MRIDEAFQLRGRLRRRRIRFRKREILPSRASGNFHPLFQDFWVRRAFLVGHPNARIFVLLLIYYLDGERREIFRALIKYSKSGAATTHQAVCVRGEVFGGSPPLLLHSSPHPPVTYANGPSRHSFVLRRNPTRESLKSPCMIFK